MTTCSESRPYLPPLYFMSKNGSEQFSLPPELWSYACQFLDWGDLARLSVVKSDYKTIMYDASRHDPWAKWNLASSLMEGSHGLASNPPAALELFTQLAGVPVDDHHRPLQTTDSDSNTIFMKESKSINDIVAKAMKEIAMLYWTKHEVLPNNESPAETGLAWMEAAHVQGRHDDAAHELAVVYENGMYGVDVDIYKAVEWFQTAAQSGHVEAMAELALCYELGLAVEQSDEMALDWYMKAANAGHLTAKYAVGEAFEEARGVPQSDEEACLWYYKAAVEGDEDSRVALRRLENIARIILPGVGKLLDE